jgi:hypothetical protein
METVANTAVQVDDRPIIRLGAAMAVGGALLAFVGNALHPRSTEYYGDPVAWLNHNTPEGTIWLPSHVLILLGQIALIGGFVALSRSLAGSRGHGVGSLALANALVGTALIMVTLSIDGLTVAQLGDVWELSDTPSQEAVLVGSILYHVIFSTFYVFQILLFGLAPILYGSAMMLSRRYARWLSWSGVLIGSSVIVTALLSLFGVATEFLDAVVWTIQGGLWALWFLLIGMVLWRRAW